MKKAKPVARPVGIVGQAFTFSQVLAEGQRRIREEEAKLAAMTPEERVLYEQEQAKRRADVEKTLALLRGPGFSEFRVK